MEVCPTKTNNNTQIVKFFGIPVYKKSVVNYKYKIWTKRKLLFGLFKTLENRECKLYYILGIRVFKKKSSINELLDFVERKVNDFNRGNTILENKIQTAIMVANQHSKVFPQFKDKHKGQSCVLVATGPSMLKYVPIKDAVHIGVNTAYQNKNINLDYWFCIDYKTVSENIDEVKNLDCIKFFGQTFQSFPISYYTLWNGHNYDNIIKNSKHAYKYYFQQGNFTNFNINIETQMLPDLRSCIFSPAYFALYAGFKKIYLVGCDAGPTGYFNGKTQVVNNLVHNLPKSWEVYSDYVKVFYPDTEIISVNPVHLKGLFTDIYTTDDGHYIDSEGKITNIIQM